jgi:preprotein translocase subunit SecF
MLFGVVVGTYSSIFIAAPVLIFLDPQLAGDRTAGEEDGEGAAEAADPAKA